MVHLLHPMLVMVKDNTCGLMFLDQEPYVQRMNELVVILRRNPERLLEKEYVAFPGDIFRAVREAHERWCAKKSNSTLIDS